MQPLGEKGTKSMLKHVKGIYFEFTWFGYVVIMICSISDLGCHMAASAQFTGLDMPTIS